VSSPTGDSAGLWRTKTRSFVEREVEPLAESIDREDRIPASLLRRLAEERFLGLGIPPEWDGVGGDTRSLVAVLEELSAGSAAVAVTVAVHLSVCAAPILTWGTERQKERYLRSLARGDGVGAFGLSEPEVGSDTARISTRYRPDGDGYVLRGTKMFISNAVTAGVVVVFATKDPALGHHGISAFIVPGGAPGFSVAQRLEKLGLRGSETTELVLDGVRLSADGLLGPEGSGLKVALGALAGGRVGIAACALGVARAAFDEMRRAVAADDAEWKRPLLARAFTELAGARALVREAAAAKDRGESFVTEASAAKLVASQAAVRIAAAGVDVAGASGVRSGALAERLLRDARVFPIVEGTTEIQELLLARNLLDPSRPRNPL
jgi:alkylation response protein AidB-like acyl-CoA dehydrogenase